MSTSHNQTSLALQHTRTMTKVIFVLLLVCVVVSNYGSSAFVLVPPKSFPSTDTTTSLNFFGNALKDAFANEDTGPKQNAGLSGGPMATEVTINGKKVQAVANQKVSVVAQAARVKINYSCNAGSCGTCKIRMNGREVRACQSVVTPKKCVIQTR